MKQTRRHGWSFTWRPRCMLVAAAFAAVCFWQRVFLRPSSPRKRMVPELARRRCEDNREKGACEQHCAARPRLPSAEVAQPPRMVALLISGMYKSSHHWARWHPGTPGNHRRYMVEAVLRQSPQAEVHTFVCEAAPQKLFMQAESKLCNDSVGRVLERFAPAGWSCGSRTPPDWSVLRGPRSQLTMTRLLHESNDRLSAHLSLKANGSAYRLGQYARIESCYLAARQTGRRFSHYVRMRLDTFFFAPLPPSLFEPHHVVLRARSVRFADECTALEAGALSWAFPNRPGTECGTSSINASSHRRRLRDAGIAACVGAADDQFAIVPSHLADAYFLMPETFPASSTTAAPPWSAASHARISAAVRLYGHDAQNGSSGTYIGNCGGRHNENCDVECRLTSRLVGRLVPLSFRTLPFMSAFARIPGMKSTGSLSILRHC